MQRYMAFSVSLLIQCSLMLSLRPGMIAAQPDRLSTKPPNIIFILTDDQGYGDCSAHGNPVLKTPFLDKLRAESVRFSDFHVSPTCAPTRSALFTGRHEFKNGVTHTILERERLTLKATTLAQVLKSAGYKTGIFGKWHLGDEKPYQPNKRGFDEVFIHGGGGIGQTYPGSCGDAPGNTYFDPVILHNGKFERTKGYCTDVFFSQATRWIESNKGSKRPFFAYIASNAPHAPLQVRPEDYERYVGKVANTNAAKYFGMVANIDDNIGRLMDKVKAWGIEEKTLIIFMNDNGGDGGTMVYNAGMRGKKGTAFLGGTRAMSFWRWPGTIKPADCGALTAHVDFFPTIAAIVGKSLSPAIQRQVEGRSLVPLLQNPNSPWEDRTLFTHLGRWPKAADPESHRYTTCSVRNTRWHLVSSQGGKEPRWMLFDVKNDYGEKTDLAASHPEVVSAMSSKFDEWWSSIKPALINEKASGTKYNPFKEMYWKQMNTMPTEADLRMMDPLINPATAPRKNQ